MKFYDMRSGNIEINRSDFIEMYSRIYYFSTNYKVEEYIEKILNNGIKSENDMRDVIAWKSGKILMKESFKDNEPIKYAKGFYDHNTDSIIPYKTSISLESLFSIYNQYDEKELYLQLTGIEGIGSVYAICLLFFKDHKKYPIYDKFADVSIKVITEKIEKIELWDEIKYRPLSNMSKETAWNYYQEYIDSLNAFFPEWKENRDIDRALWAYGHLFNIIE